MPRITGTTNAQSAFLRTFITNPAGPAAADYPAPAILRRWLRRPAFRTAIDSLQQTMEDQTDLHLAQAARAAASCLADCLTTTDENSEDPVPTHLFHPLLAIIKSARQTRRQRPTPKPPHAGTELQSSAVPDSSREDHLAAIEQSNTDRPLPSKQTSDETLQFAEEATSDHIN